MPHPTTPPGPAKRGFWYHLNRSTYVTAITDWFLGFFGKAAHLVLILTTLYTGAELLPGVSLPGPMNNAVFVLQMLVLDVGGMGLAKLAMQASDRGNEEGAKKAEDLSKWLIHIVIASLVTVAVEQAVRAIPGLHGISNRARCRCAPVVRALVGCLWCFASRGDCPGVGRSYPLRLCAEPCPRS